MIRTDFIISYSNTTLGEAKVPSGWTEKGFATADGGKGLNFSSVMNTSFFMVNVTDSIRDVSNESKEPDYDEDKNRLEEAGDREKSNYKYNLLI